MNITHFDDLLAAARAQPEPQRLLLVFAGAEPGSEPTPAQRLAFEQGHGGGSRWRTDPRGARQRAGAHPVSLRGAARRQLLLSRASTSPQSTTPSARLTATQPEGHR